MKTILLLILFIVFVFGVFSLGVLVGVNRGETYNFMRSLSDQIRPNEVKLQDDDKAGVVLFGDSLSARGDWRVVQSSDEFEMLVLARGGLKASSFPYVSREYGGEIHAFWLGTNDLLGGLDVTGAYEGVLALANGSAKAGKKIVIFGLPEPLEVSEFSRAGFREYNNTLKELCAQKQWIFYDTESLLNGHYKDRRKSSHDGLHLNLEASKMVADKFKDICRLLL